MSLFTAVGCVYCLGMLLLLAIAALLPQRPWWLAITNDVLAPLLFAPVLLLLLVATVWRAWLPGLAALVALLAFALAFAPALLPPQSPAPAVGSALRVHSFNHLFTNEDTMAVITAIRAQHADLVGLQELSPTVAQAIDRELASEFPYRWLEPNDAPTGLGILSRYPFVAKTLEPGYRGQRATIQVEGTAISIVNVHPTVPFVWSKRGGFAGLLDGLPSYGTSSRQQQLAALLAAIDQIQGPLVVTGDFNMSDRDPLYAAFAARLSDSFRTTEWGFGATFPAGRAIGPLPILPLVRIDYIWVRAGVTAHAARVECQSGGSDHCMLVADLVVTQPGADSN